MNFSDPNNTDPIPTNTCSANYETKEEKINHTLFYLPTASFLNFILVSFIFALLKV